MSEEVLNLRAAARLLRQPEHGWQLRIEDDLLITKNITDISSTGLAFKAPTSSRFESGQLLRLNLTLSQGESFECYAKIMWVRAPSSKNGVMKLFGANFINLPAKYDALITREIFDSQIREHKRATPERQADKLDAPAVCVNAVRSVVMRVLSYTVLSIMATALISAIWIHKTDHPEESIASIFNKGLLTKLETKLQPRSVQSD